MEDAGKAIDKAMEDSSSRLDKGESKSDKDKAGRGHKRKGNFQDTRMRHGSQRGGRNDNKRHKKGDLGRGEYFRDGPDKRSKTDESREQRKKDPNQVGVQFSKEEIDAEERRPKRKVAVMIGYSGTGYKGMQLTVNERTIEGDLFKAFVDAGAISKANADDPKKASLVRCARTDKGVHAAGNMISLKLIVEDENIVEKINSHLTSQIRVWGIERTTGSFSCYQAVDSRWYEYLIPSHAFLPPHPSSWLAKKLEEIADEADDRGNYEARQEEVKGFWEKVDEDVRPVLDSIDEDIRWEVVAALQGEEEAASKVTRPAQVVAAESESSQSQRGVTNEHENFTEEQLKRATDVGAKSTVVDAQEAAPDDGASIPVDATDTQASGSQYSPEDIERLRRLRIATRALRDAYIAAKRRYRIPQKRVDRIQAALSRFVGTRNYHNFTIQKTFRDPSAQRHIKSFVVNPKPILIGEGSDKDKSEWLSLKVHGQSFMMHQIRKMVGMVTLLVRSGSDLQTLNNSFGAEKYSIPKVPGLGLLLERPVFDSYNAGSALKFEKPLLLFSNYEKEIEAFKQREIYQHIFREEEEKNEFGRFFNHVDNFKEPWFLFVSSKGLEATKGAERRGGPMKHSLDDSDGEEGVEE
nr:trna pseudouridine synthase 1 [Quercus suber]